MDFSTLQSAVRDNLGGRTDKNALIKTAINLGQEDLGLRHDFKGMITTGNLDSTWSDQSSTITAAAAYSAPTTQLTDSAGAFSAGMVGYTMVLASSGNAVIASVVSSTVVTVTGDFSGANGEAYTIEACYWLNITSGYHHLLEARLIDSTSSYPLEIREKDWVTQRYPNPAADSTHKPVFAYEEGKKMYLTPYADGVYTVTGTVSSLPTDLSADADESDIDGANQALICYATWYMFDSIEEKGTAAIWWPKYERASALCIQSDKKKPAREHNMSEIVQHGRKYIPRTEYYNDPMVKRVM